MKLKINIKKYLILLVIGFIIASSFLVIPLKTEAQTPAPPADTAVITWQQEKLKATLTTQKEFRISLDETEKNWFFNDQVAIHYDLSWADGLTPRAPKIGTDKFDKAFDADVGLDPVIRTVYVGLQYGSVSSIECSGNGLITAAAVCGGDLLSRDYLADFNPLAGIIDGKTYSSSLPVTNIQLYIPFQKFIVSDPLYKPWLEKEEAKPEEHPFPKGFVIYPILDLNYNNVTPAPTPGISDQALSSAVTKFTIKVFKTKDDLKKACLAEHTADPTYCDDEKNLHESKETSSSTTGASGKDNLIGQTLADFIAQVIGTVVSLINEFIYFVTASVIAPTMEYLLGIRTYTDAFASVILPGWEVLRNLCNIFFIVVMLIIALATLFRVQNYQYKNLLISLILAAFLVNFSLVIAQGVLGIAETVQDQFLPVTDVNDPTHGTSHNVIATLANQLMREPINSFNTLKATNKDLVSSLSSITLPIFYLILAVAGFITLLSLLVFILIRIVALWILLMLSPLAYVAGVLPLTKNYRGQWWREFIKYAFFVAIIGFFLNIAAYLAQNQQKVFAGLSANSKNLGSLEQFILQVGTNLMLIVFIFAGLKAASSMGVYGAKAVTDAVTKGTLKPFRLARDAAVGGAKGVGGFVGDRITERAPILSPTQWKEGYQKYKEDYAKKYKARVEASKQKDPFGIPAKVGLNNPEQFLRNFGTAEGWKKIFQTTSQQTDKNTSEAYKERAGIQTEQERRDALLEQGKNKRLIGDINSPGGDLDRLRSSNSVTTGSAAGSAVSEALGKHIEELTAKQAQLEDARDVLQGQGKTAEASSLDAEAMAVARDIASIQADKNTLDFGAPGTAVRIGDIALGVGDADLRAELRKLQTQIAEVLTEEVKDLQEEVEKVDDEGKADDKLRKKHDFSEFNAAGKAGDPNYKEFLEDTRNEALKQAGIRADSAKGKEFSPVYNNAIIHTAAVNAATKELEEKGIELVPELIDVLERDMRNRNLSEKERAAKLEATLTKIYKEGGAKDVLERFKKDVSFSGQKDFVQNSLGLSGEQSAQLSGRLDKILNSLKQYNLSNTVQRVGGQYAYRDQASHTTAYSKKIGGLTLGETVSLPPEALVNTAKGKSPVITQAVASQFSKASGNIRELDSIRSKIAPGKARILMNSSNFGTLPLDVQTVIRDKAS